MKNKPTPDPEEFARKMLFHICSLQSQIITMMHMMARQCEPDIRKADQLFLYWNASAQKLHKNLYETALKEIGIPPTKDGHSERSANDD